MKQKIKMVSKMLDSSQFSMLVLNYDPYIQKPTAELKAINDLITRTLCRKFLKLHCQTLLTVLDEAIGGQKLDVKIGSFVKDLISKQRKEIGVEKYSEMVNKISEKNKIRAKQRGDELKKDQIEAIQLQELEITNQLQDEIAAKSEVFSDLLNEKTDDPKEVHTTSPVSRELLKEDSSDDTNEKVFRSGALIEQFGLDSDVNILMDDSTDVSIVHNEQHGHHMLKFAPMNFSMIFP